MVRIETTSTVGESGESMVDTSILYEKEGCVIVIPSKFKMQADQDSVMLYWRLGEAEDTLGAKLDFLNGVTYKNGECDSGDVLVLNFAIEGDWIDPVIREGSAFTLELAFDSAEAAALVKETLEEAKQQVEAGKLLQVKEATAVFDCFELKAIAKMEEGFRTAFALNSGVQGRSLEPLLHKLHENIAKQAFQKWSQMVHESNHDKMVSDRTRWRLHASANQDNDLQAWYHASFFQEVYRLRGQFWYRDATLPNYKNRVEVVEQVLTALEEQALAHVLCSPETTYGDVAGQMFVVQALVDKDKFGLFQHLSSQGMNIIKCPRTGRPAKKLFRFSFVEGNVYFTWKGKYGNQGVDLGEVDRVIRGAHTDVLRKFILASENDDEYMSVICDGRSIDLKFESRTQRDKCFDLLEILVAKEHGDIRPIPWSNADSPFEWLMHYSSVGVAPEKLAHFMKQYVGDIVLDTSFIPEARMEMEKDGSFGAPLGDELEINLDNIRPIEGDEELTRALEDI